MMRSPRCCTAGYGKTNWMNARISIHAGGTNQTVSEAIQEMLSEYRNPEVDQLVVELKSTFDPVRQDELAAKIHAKVVDDAAMIWVYHDTSPRALSAKIKTYVQAQSWFQDLTLVAV